MKNLLVAGNSTMPTSVGIFNLPALKTCTPSKWCRKHCYALQGRFIWRSIKKVHQQRYLISRTKDFTNIMIEEIKRRKSLKYIRIHITGDFYNEEYVRKWVRIARIFPDMIFRTNTKRQDLIPLMKEEFPSNFVVRESTDPTRSSLGIFPEASIKGTPGTAKFYICQDDCEKCKFYCWHHSKVNVVSGQIR